MTDYTLMNLDNWLFHAHMYGIYNGAKEKARAKYEKEKEEMHNAENSIWRTFIYCTARLNMHLSETLTPPTA